MRVKIYIALSSEMIIKTQFKKTLCPTIPNPFYQHKDFCYLPVDWDENDLLFTKRLQMMNKVISYSIANTIMNTIDIYS